MFISYLLYKPKRGELKLDEHRLSISEKMNLYYQFAKIPIHLLSDEEYILSYDASDRSLDSVLDWFFTQVHASIRNQSISGLLHLNGENEESFLLTILKVHEKNHYILSGPFIIAQTQVDIVNKLILKRRATLEDKEMLLNHFSSISVVNEKQSILNTQLFNELFNPIVSLRATKENTVSEKFYLHRIENKEKWYTHPPYFLEQKLLVKIKEGNAKEAEKIVHSLNTYHDAILAKQPIRSFRNSLICRCTLYTRAVIEGGVDSEVAFTLSDTYINEIEYLSDIQDLYHLDIKMIGEFTKLINLTINRKYSPLVQSALKVINAAINDKLSVEEIASKIHTNPSYLSQVFKKEVGTALNIYMNQLKIEEAKYFLSFTNSSLADIASFFQFSSQSHFTSVFKQFTTMTPLNYRKNYINSRNTLRP